MAPGDEGLCRIRGPWRGAATRDEQDLYVFTGSVIEANGTFHIFYTGHNPHSKEQGRPIQGMMHATSPDLDTWTKHPERSLLHLEEKRGIPFGGFPQLDVHHDPASLTISVNRIPSLNACARNSSSPSMPEFPMPTSILIGLS